MHEMETVSLAGLAEGAAGELFATELQKVLDNIADYSTPAEAKRSLTLTLVFKPDKKRTHADIGIACTSKVAPLSEATTVYYLGMRAGRRAAVENDPKQPGLFDETGGKVVPLGAKEDQ